MEGLRKEKIKGVEEKHVRLRASLERNNFIGFIRET
jgi:hypothetical protein